jgi:hypothetical protein
MNFGMLLQLAPPFDVLFFLLVFGGLTFALLRRGSIGSA